MFSLILSAQENNDGNHEGIEEKNPITDLKEITSYTFHDLRSYSFSSDGTYLAGEHSEEIETKSGEVKEKPFITLYWGDDSFRPLKTIPGDGARGIAFSPDDRYLVIGKKKSIKIREKKNKFRDAKTIPLPDRSYLYRFTVSPGNRYLIGSGDGETRLHFWSADEFQKIASFPGKESIGSFSDLRFSPKGRYLIATGSLAQHKGGSDKTFYRIYDLQDGITRKKNNFFSE